MVNSVAISGPTVPVAGHLDRRMTTKYVNRFGLASVAKIKLKDIDPGFKDNGKPG